MHRFEKVKKSEINSLRLKYDAKIVHMSDDLRVSKELSTRLRKEKDTYKDIIERLQQQRGQV